MRLLTGPPGSGKTSTILAQLREALKRRDSGVRLLVPTATMAEHIRHLLAREGFLVRPQAILTLSQFTEPLVGDLPQATAAELYLLVVETLERQCPPQFAAVREFPGFCAALAEGIDELATAGCGSSQLLGVAPGFATVFRSVEDELVRRGRALRPVRLQRAAQRVRRAGTGTIHTVWMDGFLSLSDPELAVVETLARQVDLIVTLPDGEVAAPSREALLRMGAAERHSGRLRPLPATESFVAATPDREADEIARRILAEISSGRLFREIGIVVRNPELYAAVLGASLERFGIPARFYFSTPLAEQPAARGLRNLVAALLSGWDHTSSLAALRWLSAGRNMDRFDFAIREQVPARGLEPLLTLAKQDLWLAGEIRRLAALDSWRSESLRPEQWVSRLKELPDTELLDGALDETARCLTGRGSLPLSRFWKGLEAVLRMSPLYPEDRRRNVVHVLSVYEARQWELPAVFVCGLVEKQFPRHFPQDPLLPEAARRQLQRQGIRIRTQADREREERFLFDLAATRATELVVFSYPESDARGVPNLRSSFLADSAWRPALACRPAPRLSSRWSGPVAIREPALLNLLAARHAVMRPSSVETFLNCPFQFFARHTLGLETRPLRPEERLDFLLQGTILHQVLAEAVRQPGDLETLYDHVFTTLCGKRAVPRGYRAEYLRREMLDNVRRFLEEPRLPPAVEIQTEWPFRMPVADSLEVRGRVDRIDKRADGTAVVIDYKRSTPDLRKTNRLQGPLYALAVERGLGLKPVGMFYCSLKRRHEIRGWSVPEARLGVRSEPLTREWLEEAERAVAAAAVEIRQGRIAPAPASPDLCARCEYRDVCRYQRAAAAMGAGS
ncbi:MAG: PD-(D/E)XK nuclease family protein [Acidobacteria bacterium]|nr:PD-(D/E)XK nuclease family protein [Acidobacteriota bacterium]